MEQRNTYRIKGKIVPVEMLFKFDLNGNFRSFELVEGIFNQVQVEWIKKLYPFTEKELKEKWLDNKQLKDLFDITQAPAILNFNAVWELFGHKIKRFEAETKWNKCNEATRIKIFTSIPEYKKYIERKGVAQTNLATYINKRYYEDDWKRA